MKRLPIIRHIRYYYLMFRVNQHYAMWAELGMFPVHAQSDYDYLNAIWRGEK